MYNSEEDKPALLSFFIFNSFFMIFSSFIFLSIGVALNFPNYFESSNRANTTMQSSEILVIANPVWKRQGKDHGEYQDVPY